MSINVTVTGNPISIQKGKMVTASPNHSKKEFDRRRLIRISQVRQQSKNIAEDIRNRVKQQKLKQIEEIEREGKKKLKQWQAKKLLELQNQCHEALKDLGAGHKEANLLEDEENILLDRKENDDEKARKRAEIATKKLREEKDRIKHNVSVPIMKKKIVRQMENRRAHMISGLRQSSESFKKRTVDKLSINTEVSGIVTESDSEYEDIDENILQAKSADNSIELADNSKNTKTNFPTKINEKEVESLDSEGILELSDHDDKLLKELREQKDTRISDRIRKRSSHQLIQPDLCDTLNKKNEKGECLNKGASDNGVDTQSKAMFSSIQQNIYACSCSKQSPVVPSPTCCCTKNQTSSLKKPVISNINSLKCFDTTDEEESFIKSKDPHKVDLHKTSSKANVPSSPKKRVPVREIPIKPKLTLKSVRSPIKSAGLTSQTNIQKKSGQSRFLSTHVERINEDSFIISPEVQNNDDFLEKIRQRDRDAIIRGQKALEKEKLQRDYNEMMKKLPALQKLERLYEMNQDKPEYHMTEDRLREQEKKKQSILDDTYEKLFPDRRPPPITIPSKKLSKTSIAENDKIPINEDSPSLNLGTWESGKKSKKLYTEEEVEALLRDGKFPSESKFRTDQLKSVLEKLRKQKEEILKEIQTQKLSEVLPFATNPKSNSKNDGNSSDSSTVSHKSKKGKSTDIKEKKFVSVKVGTNSLQSSSSYDTFEEPIKKQSKSIKHTTKLKSQAVQVTEISKKTKTQSKYLKENSKSITKEEKARKHNPCPSEQITSNLKKTTSKESIKLSTSNSDTKHKQPEKNKVDKPLTLSVPTNSLVSVNEPPNQKSLKNQSNQIKSCDCEKGVHKVSSELCEIVIKIKDKKSSEVLIRETINTGTEKAESNLGKPTVLKKLGTAETKSNKVLNEIRNALNDDCCVSKNTSKPESWHEKFSKNNSQVSTSSTSYMSPPHLSNKPNIEASVPPYFCNLIGKKPQQLNLNEIPMSTRLSAKNQDVLGEVQKLLGMSRQSIDELGISSVSTVTTPSQSIIDLESNKMNSSTAYSSTNTRLDLINEVCQSPSRTALPNFSFLTVSSDNRTIIASEIDSNEQYPDILAKYAKIADQCSQRISDLTSMIEKVREDKNRMLQTSSLLPTNDSSTKYMDLPSPDKLTNAKESTKEQKSFSSSSSGDSKLLDINFSLAEKLKGLTPEEIKNFSNKQNLSINGVNDSNNEEQDLAKRFKALKESPMFINDKDKNKNEAQISTDTRNSPEINETENASPHETSNRRDFIPLLSDIPKIPSLTADSSNIKHKKPPPSKSFMVARKFTDFVAPHELSTIPEQDSQMKFESTLRDKSPKEKDKSQIIESIPAPKKSHPLGNKAKPTSPVVAENLISNSGNTKSTHNIQSQSKELKRTILRTTSSPLINNSRNSSKTKESINHSDNSLGSSNTSCDEKVEMLRIEAMLRSIGMEWAISTLRKTQEALALTSSSSSIDIKSPSTLKQLSESDIKEYLSKQMFQKISSSTLRTDASPGSLNESQEFSDIQNSGFAYKQTSTPVNRSREFKPHEKSSDLPSAIESDKVPGDFFSLPEHSP